MTNSTYPSTNGRDTVTGYLFPPEGEPRAVVQLVHGMAEHLGRYAHFAEYLAGRGFVVCGIDHVGHGKSAASPEDYGYWGKDGPDTMVRDMAAHRAEMERQYPGLPYFLLGHSMGSFVVRKYMAQGPEKAPAGVILSGTGAKPAGTGAGHLLGRCIWAIRGDRHRSALLDRLAFGSYNSEFKSDPTQTGWEWLTRELQYVEQYQHDPACGYRFTVSAQTEMIGMVAEVNAEDWYARVPKDLPVLLLSGEMDPVGEYGKGVRRVAAGLEGAGVKDLTLTLYPGGRHEMLNEVNRDQVYADIAAWLEARLPGSAPTEKG